MSNLFRTFTPLNQTTMAKKKVNKETEPPRKRRPIIPKEYIITVADRIASTRPTVPIIASTLADLYMRGVDEGAVRMQESYKYRWDKRNAHIKESYDSFRDNLDDEIHVTNQQSK